MPNLPLPPEHHRMAPDRLPTPFSAAEIADACRPGRLNEIRINQRGEPDAVYRWEFIAGDDEWGERTSVALDPDGMPLGDPAHDRDRWTDLQAHASYPAGRTTVTVETIEIPPGSFTCWRYTVTDGDRVSHAWFAPELPGPPVRTLDLVGGEEVSAMTLIRFVDPRR